MIYFVKCEKTNYVKIGYTDNLSSRLRAIQTHCPLKILLIGCIEGSKYEEQWWHKRWGGYRLRGEWFEATPQLYNEIREAEYGEKKNN